MKIGLVLDDTLDTPDGVQQYVLNMGGWFSSQGHDVHYLVGHTQRTDIKNIHSVSRNLRVHFNGNRMSMPLPVSRRRLKTFLQEQQFDILHVQVPYSPFMAGQILRTTPPHTAVVGTFHILPYSRLVVFANKFLGILNRKSGRRFDAMMAVSEPARQFANKIYGYDASVVPNPVRLAQFAGVLSTSKATSIVFLGRLVPRKGAQHLLAAVAYLHKHHLYAAPFQVVIGGKGELTESLQNYVRQQGLESIVSFVGFVAEKSKAEFLAAADIAVFPSTSGESFGISLLEAMASSRGIVLGGDNPGYRSVLAPLQENRLIQPEHTADFAEQLAYWLSHPDARHTASSEQKQYVERFDIAEVGKQVEAVYRQILQTRPES
jgi:phosphatidylinositol alpha-mannosyltransferase